MNATPERKAMMAEARSQAALCSIELLESVAKRLERRAREMEKARAFNDEEKTQRRCMVVIYMEISNMLRAECEKLSNDALCESAGRNKTHESKGDVAAPSDSQQQMAMPPSVGNAHNNTKSK